MIRLSDERDLKYQSDFGTMRIVDAVPAPNFCMIPAQVLDDPSLGKGVILTLVRLSRFLYGRQRPLEGTTAEFAATLGVDERSLQRHLPQLGQSGWLLFSRPYRGYWTVFEIVFPKEADGCVYPKLATKLSLPVVVSYCTEDHDSNNGGEQQQHSRSSLEDSGGEAPKLSRHAPKLSPDATKLSPAQKQARDALIRLGVASHDADRLIDTYDPDFITDVIWAVRQRGSSLSNPAGFAVKAIQGEWRLPEIADKWFAQTDEDRARYISGEYADLIQH